MTGRRVSPLALAVALFAIQPRARAFTIDSGFSIGCHEGIMFTAYGQSGLDLEAAPFVLPEDDDDDTWKKLADFLLEDAGLKVDDPRTKFFLFSLFTGVRSPDTDGHSLLNVLTLRRIHDNPKGQYDHCLRAPDDDGEQGDATAHIGCIEFIANEIKIGVALLDAPPEAQNINARFTHDFYGTIEAPVWGPIYHLARAAHALQDSFTHTVRSADLRTIYSFMNYAEAIGGSLDEEEDGLPHSNHADRCDDGTRQVESAAVDATADLMVAAASYSGNRNDGHFRVFEAKWLGFQAGCTMANAYCDSPWLKRARTDPTGPIVNCAISHGAAEGGVTPWIMAVVAGAAVRRRARSARRWRM